MFQLSNIYSRQQKVFCTYYFCVISKLVSLSHIYLLAQMLRKSVETRDCLSSIEPRNVRAVMKRVVEDVTAIDSLVGQLYEEGVRAEQTSDSTRRSYSYATRSAPARSQWSATPRYIYGALCVHIDTPYHGGGGGHPS